MPLFDRFVRGLSRGFWKKTSTLAAIAIGAGCVASASAADKVRHDGDRVVRVTVADEAQLDTLLKLTDDVWSHHVDADSSIDVRMTPVQFANLEVSGLPYTVLIEDLQAQLDEEDARLASRGVEQGLANPFDDYLRWEQVNTYLNTLVALRPDLASIVVVGTSLQGRPMTAIRISSPGTGPGGSAKPAIFYHGGIHAREWITVPTVLWAADRLVRDYDTNAEIRALVDRCEFFLLPVMNPDGYIHSWDVERLWRKNRRPNGDGSIGVDLNRNFGFGWGGDGASSVPNDLTYRGPAPFSEPETQAIRNFIMARPNIVAYNDVHSYSQLLLWPWGYTDVLPPDQAEFDFIGTQMIDLIRAQSGRNYTPGPINTTIYPASGGSIDWAYGAEGIIAFSYELRDTGEFGFVLPPDQILPTAQEIFPTFLRHAELRSAPVRITFPNGLPSLAAPGVATQFDVRISNIADTLNAASPRLFARNGPGLPLNEYTLTSLGGDLYRAALPARGCGAPTEFYVTAAGNTGATAGAPLNAPSGFFTLPVGEEIETFRDNFETNLGWTVSNDPSLTSGAWVRGDPVGTTSGGPAQPEDDNPAGTGTQCYVTGQGTPGGAAGAQDVDGGSTRLTSPVFDLTGITDARLSYYRWVASNGTDTLNVAVSANGTNWVTVETVPNNRAWNFVELRVADYLPGATSVRVRFTMTDDAPASLAEAAIDDVAVSSVQCTSSSPIGDMNCDGFITVGDIAGFVLAITDPAAYAVQYPTCNALLADVNNDGFVTVGDIGGFVALLTGG